MHKKEIIISPQAEEDLDKIYNYLKQEWGEKSLQNFISELNTFLQIISYQPRIFSYLNKKLNLRKHIVYKKNLVVYKNTRTAIEIVAIFNSYQNPKKLKQTIKQRRSPSAL